MKAPACYNGTAVPALNLHALRGVSSYDAPIVQAAIAGDCAQLLFEDMQAWAVFGDVLIANQFAAKLQVPS